MKVIILTIAPDRRLFYSEVDDDGAAPAPGSAASPGLWSRLEARLHQLKARWLGSRNPAARWSRDVWEWLHRRTHPDETLYARLRHASRIDLNHPESLDAAATADLWAAFLRAGRRRHWPWFLVNTVIAPLALVLLWPLPGPNLIGYWFLYRSIHHLFILSGIRKVREGGVETHLAAWGVLDVVVTGPGDIDAMASHLDCDRGALYDFLGRQGVALAAPAARDPSTTASAHDS